MPIPSRIATAADDYQRNTSLFKKSFEGLTAEEWLRRPGDTANHLLWIAGHVLWARGNVLNFLGSPWSKPWFALFSRGAKLVDAAEYPSPEEIAAAWDEASGKLSAALEAVSEETLDAPSPQGIPSADGKIGGLVCFLAYHDTYHVGQAAYLRSWLGHGGVTG